MSRTAEPRIRRPLWLRALRALGVGGTLAALAMACTPSETAPLASDRSAAQSPAAEPEAERPLRVVALSGNVTETVYALGAGALLVATDASSTWPPEARELPQVGYHRQLPAEGVLALNPDLVLATEESGPPAVLDQLRRAGVRVEIITADATVEGALARIREVGIALGHPLEAEALAERTQEAIEDKAVQGEADLPNTLFVYARGPQQLMVAGRDTAADHLLRLVGARNAVGAFEGFRPMTAEAVVAAAPELIILTTGGVESVGGEEAVFDLPGVAQTPAAASRRLFVIDDQLALGFGPRLPEAIASLREGLVELHPPITRGDAP